MDLQRLVVLVDKVDGSLQVRDGDNGQDGAEDLPVSVRVEGGSVLRLCEGEEKEEGGEGV